MAGVLTSDDEGRLHCGVCGYAAKAVAGADASGKLVDAEVRHGVPLYVVCVLCRRYWERCALHCIYLARQGAQLRPAPRGHLEVP